MYLHHVWVHAVLCTSILKLYSEVRILHVSVLLGTIQLCYTYWMKHQTNDIHFISPMPALTAKIAHCCRYMHILLYMQKVVPCSLFEVGPCMRTLLTRGAREYVFYTNKPTLVHVPSVFRDIFCTSIYISCMAVR